MSWLRLTEIAAMLGRPLAGDDAWIEAVATDTRQPVADAVFFALKGPNFDAHDVLEQPGAPAYAGLVVSRPIKHPAPQIVVADTRLALGRLAAAWRERFEGRVVGLTGSNGKTTVKEMIASIASVDHDVLFTQGNLNNDIGVPLTLVRLRSQHEIAVIEMGANHPGEIEYLARLVRPDVALVNNAGPAHLEGFGDLDGVAKAKGEIYSGLAPSGCAVVNADDPYCAYWVGLNAHRCVLRFGHQLNAEVQLISDHPLKMRVGEDEIEVPLQLEGAHNAMNAAAAAAVAVGLGLTASTIREGLARITAFKGRLRAIRGFKGAHIIDDTYNANPASARAAIDVLAGRGGERVLVLGDMGELGSGAETLHAQVGEYARERGLERLYTFGVLSRAASQAFGRRGKHFDELAMLVEALKKNASPERVVLVKGSRSMRMDRVVDALKATPESTGSSGRHAHVS